MASIENARERQLEEYLTLKNYCVKHVRKKLADKDHYGQTTYWYCPTCETDQAVAKQAAELAEEAKEKAWFLEYKALRGK